jgi:integrase/recombinase XerD
MTAFRQRMLEGLQVRNYAPTTIAAYIRSVAEFAKHFGESPELLGQSISGSYP